MRIFNIKFEKGSIRKITKTPNYNGIIIGVIIGVIAIGVISGIIGRIIGGVICGYIICGIF